MSTSVTARPLGLFKAGVEIASAKPAPGYYIEHRFPAYGWLPEGAHLELEWDDQGRDMATNWGGPVQAPGDWECLTTLSDAPFPNGFGPDYPIVFIHSGPFAGHAFYIGHNSSRVQPGEKGGFGHVLAVADQGRNWAGTTGGWIELGEAFYRDGIWLPGPKTGRKWFDGLLEKPLVQIEDPYHYLDYPTAVPIFGHIWNERWVAQRYDTLRAQQTKDKHPHRAELATLRSHAGYLAGRIWKEAHKSRPVAWNDNRHFGEREQGMLKRHNGERVA